MSLPSTHHTKRECLAGRYRSRFRWGTLFSGGTACRAPTLRGLSGRGV